MDATFQPAVAAIRSGDVDRLRALVLADATLATSRSSTSHPTLLQCLVRIKGASRQLEMAGVLIAAGDVHGPLYACSSCDNVPAARLLLDGGAAVNGSGGWSPHGGSAVLEQSGVICLLLERGASIHNLRIAAGLRRTDVVETFFAADGFDYAGTGLHYAALNGHRATVALLIDRGADARITDTNVSQTAAGWADHGGEPEIRDLLLTRS